MRPGRALPLAGLAVLAAVLALAVACPLRHGHRVPAGVAANHPDGFDVREPACAPAPRPPAGDGDVLIRYFGVAGMWIEWRGEVVMTAPFFSRYSMLRAATGRLEPDREAIAEGLAGMPLERVGAVLVGHSHFDHLGDVPDLLLDHAVNARVVVNRSGANMLAGFDSLADRVDVVEADEPGAFDLTDASGRALPFRVLPVPSLHAQIWHGVRFADGTVDEPWADFDGRRLRAMRRGRTFAFLIDLLREDGSIAYRIYYQDAAAPAPHGIPPAEAVAEHPVDLAVLCVPGHWLADGFPETLLERAPARHALLTHYEDFLAPRDATPRYVASLTDARIADMIAVVDERLAGATDPAAAPDPAPCGPSAATWTMPLIGDWLRFRTAPQSPPPTPRPGPA